MFGFVFAWKLLLFGFALPPPSNDSFFYDGAVVNLLLHGHYCNPSLALALPISGTQVFSAYPPLYQLVLFPWMWAFGTSVLSAMGFHLILFGAYLLVLLGLFRQLNLSHWPASIAALSLFGITFHDRPDSLAHLLGLLALYSWVRSQKKPAKGWSWLTVISALLALCTSIQIGGLYCGVGFLLITFGALSYRKPLPWKQLGTLLLTPILLVAIVIFGFPHLWAGFLEHARQTPSITGLRVPRPDEVLKLLRNVPGIIAVAILWWILRTRRAGDGAPVQRLIEVLTFSCLVGTVLVLIAAMFILTPNSVSFTAYLQPLIVAGFLALRFRSDAPTCDSAPVADAEAASESSHAKCYALFFCGLAALTAIRAVGLSTWGVACALDSGYGKSIGLVEKQVADAPGETVVLSSAYLYSAAQNDRTRWIHCDWMGQAVRDQENGDWSALTTLRPAKLLLTQFDYYRRFQPLLAKLSARPDLAHVVIQNSSHFPTPDSIPLFRRVLQHISWAPVVVVIQWVPESPTK